ncbi:LysR substrate-binding domain-containing protein [Sphingobium sp. SJ10-10]|uniref:LysR substrate-binding domain-containing protein n=1 Tax=Sphingobium sp. SJ10-10 TaxID=3114999 RepID=UPI002E187863|nr:LysR substrate-binding domain-containing protein [Sphingobium sp. SJ10-10]
MKLHQFRDLLAVAETGSLRAAARHLGLAQPVITRSIQELERELGIPLFERHAKGVALTESGKTFVRRVEAFQADLQRAREEIAQSNGHLVGEITVAFSAMVCLTLLPRIVKHFYKKYPKVVLKISESMFQEVESSLENGLIDFWVGPLDTSIRYPRLSIECLFDTSRRVVGRKNHPLQFAHSLSDLAEASWVRPAISKRNTESDFDKVFEKAELPPPQIMFQSGSPLITMLTVANTDFLTMLPQHILALPTVSELVRPFNNIDPFFSPSICCAKRYGLPLTPAAEYLCDLIRKLVLNHILEDTAGAWP